MPLEGMRRKEMGSRLDEAVTNETKARVEYKRLT